MSNSQPSPKVNKFAIAGITLSLIGLILSLLSILFYANLFSSNQKPANDNTNVSTSNSTEVASNFDIAGFYQKVDKGQTRATVLSTTREQPYCMPKNFVEGYGEIEYCEWSKSTHDKNENVTVTFVNGVVDGKSKVGF